MVLPAENGQAFGWRIAATLRPSLSCDSTRLGCFYFNPGSVPSMKRFSMAVILGLTLMLLALAPQLRVNGYDHFNYEHGNTLAATSSSPYDVDAHSNAWRDDDDDRRGDGNWGGWGMHVVHSASGSDADSG